MNVFALALLVASADMPSPPAALDYEAAPGCPDGAEFRALLAAVAPHARLEAADGLAADRIVVRVEQRETGARGTLRSVARNAGASEARELVAATCMEVVEALAFTAALALSPDDVAAAPPTIAAAASQAEPTPPPAWWFTAGAGASGELAATPLATAAISLARGRPFTRWGLHAPLLAATLRHARNDVVGAPGDARFALSTVSLAACPFGGPLGTRAQARACAEVEAGAIAAQGLTIAHPTATTVPWIAAGASARLAWSFAARVAVSLRAAIERPLVPVRFRFDVPERPVASSADVAWHGAIEIAVRFR